MIGELLPFEVVAVEAFGDLSVTLFPEEEALIGRAVERRRREFATVRGCAREALGKLGFAPAPIVSGLRGAPVWPEGVVGSMTHCAGYRAAVVALGSGVWTVGVDAEPNEALPDGVLDLVSSATEREWIADLAARRPEVSWARLLFSAKESVYKAWFPITRRWLDFAEAELSVDPDARTFSARILVDGPVAGFEGRWLADRGLVVTAIAVSR